MLGQVIKVKGTIVPYSRHRSVLFLFLSRCWPSIQVVFLSCSHR